jgi:hypothetical protein
MVEQAEDIAMLERARLKLVQRCAGGNEIMRMILATQVRDKSLRLMCFGVHVH